MSDVHTVYVSMSAFFKCNIAYALNQTHPRLEDLLVYQLPSRGSALSIDQPWQRC